MVRRPAFLRALPNLGPLLWKTSAAAAGGRADRMRGVPHVPGDEPGGNAAVQGAELRHLGAHLGLQHAHGPVLADAVLRPAEPVPSSGCCSAAVKRRRPDPAGNRTISFINRYRQSSVKLGRHMTGVKSIRFLYTGYIKTLQRVYFTPATTLKSEETVKKTVEIVQHIPHKQSRLHNFCRLLVKCDITKGRMLKKGLVNFRQSYYHTERKKTNEPEKGGRAGL